MFNFILNLFRERSYPECVVGSGFDSADGGQCQRCDGTGEYRPEEY